MKTMLMDEFQQRLVPLCDGRAGLRGSMQVEVGETENPADPSDGPCCLDFIASSETLDRFHEIICVDGWQLENYRRNPIFQNAHQYGDILFTLGKALITEVRSVSGERVLFQRIQFATEVNPIARIAYGLYQGKFLNAVSVGFIPVRWETGDQQAAFRRRFLEQELLEVSAVGIPANPEALALGLKAGAIAQDDVGAALELLSTFRALSGDNKTQSTNFRSHPADPQTHARASGLGNNEAQGLRLERELAALWKIPPSPLYPSNAVASAHSNDVFKALS